MATMIHFSNITKQFPGNKALDSVDFTVDKGEIHALLGENGAGKSTLLNILHGIYPDYDGNVEIDGRKVGFKNANDAIEFGIAKVHQEVNLVTELTVGQNIALGYEVTRGFLWTTIPCTKNGCYPGKAGLQIQKQGPCDLSQHWRDADDSDCQGIVSQCKNHFL